jgi:hypothetical protein
MCATTGSKRAVTGDGAIRRWTGLSVAALGAWCVLGGVARAADATQEVWPELNLFYGLDPRTRLFFDFPYSASAETDTQSFSLEGYLDVSLKPILRESLQTQDWQRNRYLWMRVGYARVDKATNGERQTPEDRGVVAIYGRAPLPAEIWVEGRVRADFRWIDNEYSNRWRFRLEVNREFTVCDHSVTPYFNVESFYDTRYDSWTRTLFQGGTEIKVNQHFRYEVYLARQNDHAPRQDHVNAVGLNAKWYY